MKNLFLGLVFATSLVASAYSHGCQQRYNRHAQPLVDIAPNWSVHFPKFDSFWGQDLLDDPWQMFDHITDDPFHIFKPLQQEAKPVERIQCKTSGVDTPLNDVPMKSDAKADSGSNEDHSSTFPYEDWSEEAELLRRQEWEKKLQEDVQREQQRREDWYQKKVAKVREEQEQRERLLAQERQRQQDLLKKQEEELIRREEQMRRKRQGMEEKLRREQKLEEKRREEEIRQAEERERRVREARRVHEEARQRELQRQEQLRREQWLQEKKHEEQQRQTEDFRRQEERRAEERLRILEEKQRVTQKELEEKIRLQREKVRLEEERQQEELRRKREQWAEQQRGTKQHFNSHSFHESSSSHHHNSPRSDGSEQVIFDMVLTGYYPADLSVRVRDGILQIEGSHVCACKEDCFMREFERKATIPSGVDTQSLSASLDSEGNFKVTGIQYRHPVQQNDTDIPVFGIHMPRQMPPALKYCPEGKTTYKLAKIDPATGSTHRRNAYKFERRKSHTEDDGVTIEVAEDYA